MDPVQKAITRCEAQLEEALTRHEQREENEAALEAYLAVETELLALNLSVDRPAYREQQRVLAYALMRAGNMLRQLGRQEDAAAYSAREIAAARASGDGLTLARSLMSHGVTRVAGGAVGEGLAQMEEAADLFRAGEEPAFMQGLGWYWILRADIINAGLEEREPEAVLDAGARALALLGPLENWPGIARAHAARVVAYEKLGDQAAARTEREQHSAAIARIGK